MKRKRSELSEREYIVTLDALYTAASSVKGRDATKLFLRDLLTQSERIMLGRRVIIARMLIAEKSYEEIQERLRVGPTTVRKVHKWLEDQFPGFENAIKEMEKEFDKRAQRAPAEPYTLAWMKKRYPLHFLLFPTPKRKHDYGQYPKRSSKNK